MHATRIEHQRHRAAVTSAPATRPAGVQPATAAVLRLQAVAGNRATAGTIARMRAGQRSPASGMLQRLAYDDPPANWGAVTIKRSKEGLAGVYFIDSGTDRIVVKPVASAAPTQYADMVMQKAMGLDAPRTTTYAKTSAEGQQIATLLTTGPVHGAKTPTETQDVINTSNYFLVMSNVVGKSIQRLDDVEATDFIQNNEALKAVGRIMVADAFLGNSDRLLGTVNLGNFFYAVAAATGAVRTIDNASTFEAIQRSPGGKLQGNLSWKLQVIEDLIDPATRILFINLFLARFRAQQNAKGNVHAVAAYDARIAAARSAVSLGVVAGLTDLTTSFKANIDLVRAVAFSPEPESVTNRNPDEAKGLAHYIRARHLEGTTKTKAVSKLNDYLAYRNKRNATPEGRKWVTRLFSDVGFSFA